MHLLSPLPAALFTQLGKAVSRGLGVRITMGKIGVLIADDHRVSINFFQEEPETATSTGLTTLTARLKTPAAASEMPLTAKADLPRLGPARGPNTRAALVPSRSAAPTREKAIVLAKKKLGRRVQSANGRPPKNAPASSNHAAMKAEASAATSSAVPVKASTPPPAPMQPSPSQQVQFPLELQPVQTVASQLAAEYPRTAELPTTPAHHFSSHDPEHVRHLPGGVDVDLNIKPTSIFPTFSQAALTQRSGVKETSFHRTALEEAYHRLQGRLAQEKAVEDRLRAAIKARQDVIDQGEQKKKADQKLKQAEWRAYLMKQADDLRQMRQAEHNLDFKVPAPSNVTAYPQLGLYDRSKRRDLEKSIKKTLDEQVIAKLDAKKQVRQRELDQDQLLIEWVKQTDMQERNNKLAKKIIERESLFREWDMQKAHSQDIKRMGAVKIG